MEAKIKVLKNLGGAMAPPCPYIATPLCVCVCVCVLRYVRIVCVCMLCECVYDNGGDDIYIYIYIIDKSVICFASVCVYVL